MEVQFLRAFEKDLGKADAATRRKVLRIVLALEAAGSIKEIDSMKKLVGFKEAYRKRIGDHRPGLFHANGVVQLARLLHRREVYRYFP